MATSTSELEHTENCTGSSQACHLPPAAQDVPHVRAMATEVAEEELPDLLQTMVQAELSGLASEVRRISRMYKHAATKRSQHRLLETEIDRLRHDQQYKMDYFQESVLAVRDYLAYREAGPADDETPKVLGSRLDEDKRACDKNRHLLRDLEAKSRASIDELHSQDIKLSQAFLDLSKKLQGHCLSDQAGSEQVSRSSDQESLSEDSVPSLAQGYFDIIGEIKLLNEDIQNLDDQNDVLPGFPFDGPTGDEASRNILLQKRLDLRSEAELARAECERNGIDVMAWIHHIQQASSMSNESKGVVRALQPLTSRRWCASSLSDAPNPTKAQDVSYWLSTISDDHINCAEPTDPEAFEAEEVGLESFSTSADHHTTSYQTAILAASLHTPCQWRSSTI